MVGYGWGNMMSWGGYGLSSIVGIVVLVDLILLGFWLWKQISKQ